MLKVLVLLVAFPLVNSVQGEKWAGINIHEEKVTDNYEACVWEPSLVKKVNLQ